MTQVDGSTAANAPPKPALETGEVTGVSNATMSTFLGRTVASSLELAELIDQLFSM